MARKHPIVRQKQPFHELPNRNPKMELGSRPEGPNPVTEDSLLYMRAGDIIFLDESSSLRPLVETDFFAVLSCPCCGTSGLITPPQYRGVEPVICGSDACSCRFRISEKMRFEFLPAN
jgi:hypothetical protein